MLSYKKPQFIADEKLYSTTGGLGLGDAYGATLDRIKGQGGEKDRLVMAL